MHRRGSTGSTPYAEPHGARAGGGGAREKGRGSERGGVGGTRLKLSVGGVEKLSSKSTSFRTPHYWPSLIPI